MGRHVMMRPVMITLGVCFFLHAPSKALVEGASPETGGTVGHGRARGMPLVLNPRANSPAAVNFLRARIEPALNEILIDDSDDFLETNKRQFDDYGHMRFGKRGEVEEKFDDYGHMRFGRSHP